jgi:hypothetical protein
VNQYQRKIPDNEIKTRGSLFHPLPNIVSMAASMLSTEPTRKNRAAALSSACNGVIVEIIEIPTK